MALKLISPTAGRTSQYRCRGTYLGVVMDRSTKTADEREARGIIKTWKDQIKAGTYQQPSDRNSGQSVTAPTKAAGATGARTFLEAAVAYLKSGGEGRFMESLIEYFGETPLTSIDQIMLDDAATHLYPEGTAQTRNRQFYTPMITVLHHGGIDRRFKRPKGWRGNKATEWLQPEQAFRLLAAADAIDAEFGLMCRTLLYTGMRLSEALRATVGNLMLGRAMIYLPKTKNGEERAVHLPPHLVAAFRAQPPRPGRPRKADGRPLRDGEAGRSQIDAGVPFLKRHPEAKLFRFHNGGALRELLSRAMRDAGLSFPRRMRGFHLFCHTYGSWMGDTGLDAYALARTGRWKDPRSADRYRHTKPSAEARKADLLPVVGQNAAEADNHPEADAPICVKAV